MTVAEAEIAAAAAIMAAFLTGGVTWLTTRSTVRNNTKDLMRQLADERDNLMTQLGAERAAAREDRDQQRRKEAYVELNRYVDWLAFEKAIEHIVIDRAIEASAKVRNAHLDTAKRFQDANDERETFLFCYVPTKSEQEDLDLAPNVREKADIRALIEAVASEDVLAAFEDLRNKGNDFSKRKDELARIWNTPVFSRTETYEGAEYALAVLKRVERFIEATPLMTQAFKDLTASVESIKKLIRMELNALPTPSSQDSSGKAQETRVQGKPSRRFLRRRSAPLTPKTHSWTR